MTDIQMVDLKRQYDAIKEEIDLAIAEVVASTSFVKGPEVKHFQDELSEWNGCRHTIACANGTDALQLALMALGLKPGDEVITSDFTFIATVEVIALLGLTPVLVDVLPDTFNIDPKAVERAITPRTKVIMPVHLFGQCADMDTLLAIAQKHHLFVIEDVAQAIGAKYTSGNGQVHNAGNIGNIGCTSFFPSKNLGCFGDGGALFTNDDALAERIATLANHGMKVRYYHDMIGINSRLDSLQAAILRVKLRYLDGYILARQKAADYYDQAFASCPGIIVPGRSSRSTHVFHQYTLQVPALRRNALQEFLAKAGIPSMIYYPVALHNQKAFEPFGNKQRSFPVTDKLCQTVISLPMHTELDEEQLAFITSKVLEFFQ